MTGYPALRPSNAVLIPPPKHDDLTHYPKWSKTRDENIVAFRNFLYANDKGADLTEFDQLLADAPSDIHWATIAEQFVHLHWVQ